MKAEYIDHMGSDEAVCDAARISMDKVASTFSKEENDNLIRYLARGFRQSELENDIYDFFQCDSDADDLENLIMSYRNRPTHWSPFAHQQIKLRMKAPVPIRTQAFKHKQGFSENEESRRYISSCPELFIPEFRWKADNVKQGSSKVIHSDNDMWKKEYTTQCNNAINMYMAMLDDGICPEQARLVLPQGVYVNWIWTGSLAAYARFYNQRTDPHAQQEIRDLAKQVGDIIKPLFPVSWGALTGDMQ